MKSNRHLSITYRNGLLLIICSIFFTLQSCKKSHSDIGQAVFKETRNKIFKDIETDVFIERFKESFDRQKSKFKNPKFLAALYEAHDFEPLILMRDLPNHKLEKAVAILNDSHAHGLKPESFQGDRLNELLKKVYDKKAIKSVDEAYQLLIDLELTAANSITNYSNAIQFGMVSPRKIFAQYYTETKRPDSSTFMSVFETKDLTLFLDSIQPKSKEYLTLQKALKDNIQVPGTNKEESERIIIVNLERLRWKNTPSEEKYVWVNIPDFRLDVIEKGKSVLNMKVCVGEGRNQDYKDKLVEYDENDLKKDRPFNRETPQLKSIIHSVQVNPVWNIPESIATNEITKFAAKDPYYLSNHNIDVFLNGKIVEDTETIDWSSADAGKTYSFKQRPGEDNALGKIKFLFNNESSVYLHDTPSKAAFNQTMRAVSHGCVRVEKPFELAQALFGEGSKLEKIKAGMEGKRADAENIALSDKVPVYLTYATCWVDSGGVLQFRKDVYGLDIVLYTYLQRVG